MLKSLLAHPLTCGLDLDDPRTTELRRRIIQEKSFLRQIYQDGMQPSPTISRPARERPLNWVPALASSRT
jgi:hypothetical protein